MLREEPVRAETRGASVPRTLKGGSNGVRATFESARERSRRFLGFHMVLILGRSYSPSPVRPFVLSSPGPIGPVHVEPALFAANEQIAGRTTIRLREKGRFSISRYVNTCITESCEVCTRVNRRACPRTEIKILCLRSFSIGQLTRDIEIVSPDFSNVE